MALTRESTTSYSAPPGKISSYGGGTVPTGWLLCDGSSVAVATYPLLWAAIGYTYGGSGANFNLPDGRTNVLAGYKSGDSNFGTLGVAGGTAAITLTATQLPGHTHSGTTNAETADHTHSGTTGTESAAHAHSVSAETRNTVTGGSYGAGEFPYGTNVLTSASGTATESANHAHSFTTGGRSAAHTHTFTTDSGTGGSGSHPNLQPYTVVNHIIKF